MGAPAEVAFPKLISWTERPEKEIRYYSGIATYQREIRSRHQEGQDHPRPRRSQKPGARHGERTAFPELWKPPFTCDITSAVKPGANTLAIEVANLWANRLVGDEQEPEDVAWETKRKSAGIMPLAALPDWLLKGTPRPSSGRRAFSTWNYVQKDQKLLPSGLLGPVVITVEDGPAGK